MTYREAKKRFNELHPWIRKERDYYAKEFAWSCFIDSLCKGREITQKQYDTWPCPYKHPYQNN